MESAEWYPDDWIAVLLGVVVQYPVRELLAVPLQACKSRNKAWNRE
jgi:hypothetical protein